MALAVFGVLKGFDQLMNLVMDEVSESLRDEEGNVTDKTRSLGLVVLRGTALTVINPADGFESIEKYVYFPSPWPSLSSSFAGSKMLMKRLCSFFCVSRYSPFAQAE